MLQNKKRSSDFQGPRFVVGLFLFITCLMASLACPVFNYADDFRAIKLPAPDTQGGKPLMQALSQRQSGRAFSYKEVPLQVLSDLLWAAFGVNRPDTGNRTAPSAFNLQEICVYVARGDGLYYYDAKANVLVPVVARDIRVFTGSQPFVKEAPIELIYVAELRKMDRVPATEQDFYAAADTAFISENVYLFCASAGLTTVVRNFIDKVTLSKEMGLRHGNMIVLAQSVGYPKD